MKKILIIQFILVLTLLIFVGTNSYAAWWGTPGYEWALSKGLTSIKTQTQLNRKVTLSDYYNTIIKYLKMKGTTPKDRIVQSIYVDNLYNGAVEGMISQVNSYISSNSDLTPQKYKELNELVEHSKKSINDFSNYLTRDDLKDIELYLDLAKYKGAMLLSEKSKIETEYKNNVLYSLRNIKYKESLTYGIMPMIGRITRGDFLVLMHNLLSSTTKGTDDIIRSFNESGVLQGYYDKLWLDKEITYSEMLTFMHRFENYEFNPTNNAEETDNAE